MDRGGEQGRHHGGETGEEGRFWGGRELQANGLKRVSGEEKCAGESATRQRPARIPGMAPGTAEENQKHDGRQGESQGQKKDRRYIAQGLLDQYKCGPPDDGVDDQRGFGAALGPESAPLQCEVAVNWGSRSNRHRVSIMRFKPRSRPSGLNHSCVVCAPPPWPPAPIEMAGMPSDMGMLASVEAQSRWERMPRWLSTARR